MTSSDLSSRFQRLLGGRTRNDSSLAYYKYSSRNFVSVFITLTVIILLTVSFCTNWFVMYGGSCSQNSLDINPFLHSGELKIQSRGFHIDYSYTMNGRVEVLHNCITHDIYVTMKTNLSLLFLAVFCSMFQLVLDLLAPSYLLLKVLQINAIGSFLTILFCTTVIGLNYWVSVLLYQLQVKFKSKPGMPVFVNFSTGFYLIAFAAGLSILAACTNCFHYPFHVFRVLNGQRRTALYLRRSSGQRGRTVSRRSRRRQRSTCVQTPPLLRLPASNSPMDDVPLITDCGIESPPPPYSLELA